MPRFVIILLSVLVLAVSCGGADADESIDSFAIGVYEDPAAFDDVFAEADRTREDGQVIVTADFTGCEVLSARATPRPTTVSISIEFDEDVTCAEAFEFRAIFLIDAEGENSSGEWDYTVGSPDIVLLTR